MRKLLLTGFLGIFMGWACFVQPVAVEAAGGSVTPIDTTPPSGWLPGFAAGTGLGLPSLPAGGGIFNYILPSIVQPVMGWALFILIIASTIMLLIGGIRWIISSGDKEGLAKARATITWAIIGLATGLAAVLILEVVGSLLGSGFYIGHL